MSYVIYSIRTDEGFGNGIYTYWSALYFLYQTTTTIGLGDIMMSGGSAPVTLLLGAWLASSIGVFVCLLSAIGEAMGEFQRKTITSRMSRRISRLSDRVVEGRKIELTKQNCEIEHSCKSIIMGESSESIQHDELER